MRLNCLHGYFIFQETKVGQVSDFMSLTGMELIPKDGAYTFAFLEDAPLYSIAGKDLLGLPAVETYEGTQWAVFEANGFVYDLGLGIMRPIDAITQTTKVELAGNRFISPGLIQPGSLTDQGRVKNYSAWFSRDTQRWLYSEVTYV